MEFEEEPVNNENEYYDNMEDIDEVFHNEGVLVVEWYMDDH